MPQVVQHTSTGMGSQPARARAAHPDVAQRAPFRSQLDVRTPIEAAVTGSVPEWLAGDLLRTAPAIFRDGAFSVGHWFDALGMLYRFRVSGGAVSFHQQLMHSEVQKAAARGEAPRASFATPVRRGVLERVRHPIPPFTDNVNVNVVPFGSERVALTETPHQWVVDSESLELTRPVEYTDEHGTLSMIAHPHFDFERGQIVSLAVRFGRKTQILLYEHAAVDRQRRIVGHVDVARLPYIHAFGLTPRHAVIIGHPFTVSPLSLLGTQRGFIDHFAWRPSEGTTLWLIDREDGSVRRHSAPAGFVFHVVNAFEDGGQTSIDLSLFPDPSIVDQLRTGALAQRGLPDVAPRVVRWTVAKGRDSAVKTVLSEPGFDFPQVSYRRRNGQRHGVAWGARIAGGASPSSTLVRLDLERGERTYAEPGFVYGEPLFVARPGAEAEDDGVVLSVGSHAVEARSALVVLDAKTLSLLGRAEVPLSIPLGFHGSFFRA